MLSCQFTEPAAAVRSPGAAVEREQHAALLEERIEGSDLAERGRQRKSGAPLSAGRCPTSFNAHTNGGEDLQAGAEYRRVPPDRSARRSFRYRAADWSRRDGRSLSCPRYAAGRDVAIKILPQFTNDPDRLARFEREARLLASLNHPNIASSWRSRGELVGTLGAPLQALVMELVAGETLTECLRAQRQPGLPLPDALESPARSPPRSRRRTEGSRPPRFEAGEHHAPVDGLCQGARFRVGQGVREQTRRTGWAVDHDGDGNARRVILGTTL